MQLPSDAMTSHVPAGVRGSQVEGSVNELKHEHNILTESKYLDQSKRELLLNCPTRKSANFRLWSQRAEKKQ